MTSKAANSRQMAPLASRALKTVGVIIIIAALLDIVILPMPYNPLDRQWQIAFVTQVVDRGIVPLVGLALLFTGYWIDSLVGNLAKRKLWFDMRFWALLLASLMGLFYLMAIVLHVNNVFVARGQALERISQDAAQAETQLETRLSQEVQQQREQIDVLVGNPEIFEQALQSGQVSQEQAALLEQFRDDPEALEQFLDNRVSELETQVQTEIGLRREQAEQEARMDALKSAIRVGGGSFLLAVGYIAVGWTGLKTLDADG
jgi:hypothetical protein